MAKRSARKTGGKRVNKTAAIRSILKRHPEAKPAEGSIPKKWWVA